ncbi:MAG TPA: hypothetical protein VFM69_06355 [Pricia sp.]|nr:hypothetical protein [Pricia sp.]
MAGTLYAIGFPVFTITLSALLMYAASFMPRELQKAYNLFAVLTSFTGFYFLIWCINPYVEKDFNPVFYYGAMILISSALTHATVYIEQYFNRLTSIVHYLLRVIYSADKDGYIKESKQGEYDKVKVEAVDYVVENER